MQASTIALLVLIPLLVWRLYWRLKNLTCGRRRSRAWRHWSALLGFSGLIAAGALGAGSDLLALSSLGAGTLAGLWLARLEGRLTRFENTGHALFFTPSPRLGIALAMLFAGRLLYRGVDLYLGAAPPASLATDPLTLLSLGLCGAYFAACGGALLLWRRSQGQLPG